MSQRQVKRMKEPGKTFLDKATSCTLTYHPHNLTAKNTILKNFKLLKNDNETGRIFSQPHWSHSNGTKT